MGTDNAGALVGGLKAKQPQASTTPTGAMSTVLILASSVAETEQITLHGATPVLQMPAPVAAAVKRLQLIQDATGSRVPSWTATSGAVMFTGNAAPTLTTAATSIDQLVFWSDGVNWYEQSRNLNVG